MKIGAQAARSQKGQFQRVWYESTSLKGACLFSPLQEYHKSNNETTYNQIGKLVELTEMRICWWTLMTLSPIMFFLPDQTMSEKYLTNGEVGKS